MITLPSKSEKYPRVRKNWSKSTGFLSKCFDWACNLGSYLHDCLICTRGYIFYLSLSIYKLFSINQLPGLHIGMLKNIQNLVILFILKFTFCLTRCFLFRCRWYKYFFLKYLDTSKSICKKKFVDFYKFTIAISILKFNHLLYPGSNINDQKST